MLGQQGSHETNKKLILISHPIERISSKLIRDLFVKDESIQVLKENLDEFLHNLVLGKGKQL